MDYTHKRYVIRDKVTNRVIRTVSVRIGKSAKLRENEKLAECIGGYSDNAPVSLTSW